MMILRRIERAKLIDKRNSQEVMDVLDLEMRCGLTSQSGLNGTVWVGYVARK